MTTFGKPLLRAGDRVALVSPAGPSPTPSLERATALLGGWGLDVVVGRHAADQHPTLPYLAGSDLDRRDDLQWALTDPDIAAVFCARGGYGCLRLLDLLDVDALAAATPRPLIGSSDVTALHLFLEARLERSGLFAPMVATGALLDDDTARGSLHSALFDELSGASLGSAEATALVEGTAHGRLAGGNLSLLSTTALSFSGGAPDNRGRIGMIEDVGEAPYRIDHMMTHLARAGWFDGMVGIAFGSWADCPEPETIRAVLDDRFGGLGIPIVNDLGFGHGAGAFSFPTGATATLTADGTPRLVLD